MTKTKLQLIFVGTWTVEENGALTKYEKRPPFLLIDIFKFRYLTTNNWTDSQTLSKKLLLKVKLRYLR
jgi:hypothetical protein